MRYKIADYYIDRLTKKAKRVGNKCAALGLPFEFEIQEADEIVQYRDFARFSIPAHWVELSGVAKINGWTFVAKIQVVEDQRVILCAPNQTCPEHYRTAPMVCDHCHTNRNRNETFVIVSDSGEYKQVGRNCLALYTGGLDAEGCAQFAEFNSEIDDLDDFFPSGIGGEFSCPLQQMVAVCYAIVKDNGYDRETTKEEVWKSFSARAGGYDPKEALDKYGEEADAIIAEARAISDASNDYLANVKALFSCDYGYETKVAFYASYAARFIREKAKRKAFVNKMGSTYIGEVGKRVKFDIKNRGEETYRVLYTKTCDVSYYYTATSYVIEFIDVNGNVIIWSASNVLEINQAIEDGKDVISLVGTVKEHSEFRGVKQTKVTRVRLA